MTHIQICAPDQDRKRGHDRPPRIPDGDGRHPSFLALDRAALGSRTAGVSAAPGRLRALPRPRRAHRRPGAGPGARSAAARGGAPGPPPVTPGLVQRADRRRGRGCTLARRADRPRAPADRAGRAGAAGGACRQRARHRQGRPRGRRLRAARPAHLPVERQRAGHPGRLDPPQAGPRRHDPGARVQSGQQPRAS